MAKILTNKSDYAPGETAIITADDFAFGSAIEFYVQHTGPGPDGILGTADDSDYNYTGSGHEPWNVTDGISWVSDVGADGIAGTADDLIGGDLDQTVNGSITTTWYVNPDDSLNENFLLTATGNGGTPSDTGDDQVATTTFTDSGGAYTLKWTAADPALNKAPYLPTYAKITPEQWLAAHGGTYPGAVTGRAADPLANAVEYVSPFLSSNQDAVTSLTPKDMALGQIVPFFIEIKTNGNTTPENGVIQFTTEWLSKTTSGGDFGFDNNYGVIAAFVDTADPGTIDPNSNAKVDSFTWVVAESGTNNERIQGTFNVSGLSSGENTVVEIWVVLDKTIGAGITGNVQTGLVSAKTASNDVISTGNQTVPLLQVGDFFTSDVDLVVINSDNPAIVTAGEDAATTLIGSQLTYTIKVDANHLFDNKDVDTASVANGVVVYAVLDPNTSYVAGSASNGGFINTDSTDTIPDGAIQWNLGSLSPGASQSLTYAVKVLSTAPTATPQDLTNTVYVKTISDDKDATNNSNVEHTDVLDARWSIITNQTISEPATAQDSTGNYTVSLTGASLANGQTVTMTLDALSGTATEGADFQNFLSTLTGLQGVTAGYSGTTLTITNNSGVAVTGNLVSFEINALADTIAEPNETFTTQISAPSLGFVGTGSVTTTITDITTLTVSIDDATAVNEGQDLVYTVTLSGGTSASDITIPLTYDVAGTATPVLDYNGNQVNVTIKAGESTGTVTVPALTDSLLEGAETVLVNLGTPNNAAVSVVDGQGTGTILDIDKAVITLNGPATVNEGATTTAYAVTLNGVALGAGQSASFTLDTVSGTATEGIDFSALLAAGLTAGTGVTLTSSTNTTTGVITVTATNKTTSTLAAGSTLVSFAINSTNDATVEGAETYSVALTSATVMVTNGSVTTTINDTNSIGTTTDTATWSITGSTSVNEGANASYTVSLGGTLQAGETATVQLKIANISTTSADYANFSAAVQAAVNAYNADTSTTTPGTLSWNGTTLNFTSDGAAMGNLVIRLGTTNDTISESAEQYTVSLATPGSTTGANVIGTGSVTTTIADDDSVAQITGTGITAQQYIQHSAPDFSVTYAGQGGAVQYNVDKAGKVGSTNPGVFFYYTGLSNTIKGFDGPDAGTAVDAMKVFIDQSDNSALFGAFRVTSNDVKLFKVTDVNHNGSIDSGDTLAQVQLSKSQIVLGTGTGAATGAGPGDVTVNFTPDAIGSLYVMSVQCGTGSVVGTNVGTSRPTVHYDFKTDVVNVGAVGSYEETDSNGINLAPKLAALTLDGDPVQDGYAPVLQETALQSVIDQAIAYWAQHGANLNEQATLRETQVQISDLGGKNLGLTDAANNVTIDDDAAGYGWFTGYGAVNLQNVDLLSVVTHEFGHVLGYEHDLMDPTLAVGVRDLPNVDVSTVNDMIDLAGVQPHHITDFF